MDDWNEGDEQSRLLNVLPEAWVKRVRNEEANWAKGTHTVKMMLNKEHHKKVVDCRRAKVARDFKRQSLRKGLLITVLGDRVKAAIWCLYECEVGGQTICLQVISPRMSCNDVIELIGEEVLKEYKNPAHNRGLQGGDRSVHQVGAVLTGKPSSTQREPRSAKVLTMMTMRTKPAETTVPAFMADNLHKGGSRGNWRPLQQGWRKRKKKEPCRVSKLPLSFGEFIRAHPQSCFVCCGRTSCFQHDHWTCPIHKADTEAYKKAYRTKQRTSANIRKPKVEVSKDELSKLMMVGTELAKEIQEIKR